MSDSVDWRTQFQIQSNVYTGVDTIQQIILPRLTLAMKKKEIYNIFICEFC